MNALEPLEPEQERLVTAYHELGHALTARAVGLKVSVCRITTRWWDSAIGGYVQGEPYGETSPAEKLNAHGVTLLAGQVAEVRALIELEFLPPSGAERRAAYTAGWDLEMWERIAPYCTIGQGAARERAERIVTSRWDRIAQLAPKLAEARSMAGSRL